MAHKAANQFFGECMKKVFCLILLAYQTMIYAQNQEIKDFWNWFSRQSDILFNFENDQEKIFDQLSIQLSKVDKNLTFEFGPIENNKREFIISAAGILSSFPSVESIYANHPNLDKWIFIKYRPRREVINIITYQGISINPKDVQYLLFKDEDPKKVGVLVFIKNYQKSLQSIFHEIGYLFLDEALGEYDVETYIGGIDFMDFGSKYYSKSSPITDLAKSFDEYMKNL
jgi:hypothetical protein